MLVSEKGGGEGRGEAHAEDPGLVVVFMHQVWK